MPNNLLNRAPSTEHRVAFSVTARQGWHAIAASLLLHGVIVSTFIVSPSRDEPEAIAKAVTQQLAPEQVTMIYIPEQPAPAPSPPREEPPRRQPPAPDAVPAEEDRTSRGTRQSDDAPAAEPSAPEPGDTPDPAPVKEETETANAEEPVAAPVEAEVPTMESEARRIFGQPEPAPHSDLPGPRVGIASAAELARQYEAERSNCRMEPTPPREPGEPIELGVAIGRVFRPDRRTPVAGAFLHVLGTRWSTFTDGSGVYRLEFDASLVDHCRTQTVRVTADGYQMRDLILGVGYGADDVILHRF